MEYRGDPVEDAVNVFWLVVIAAVVYIGYEAYTTIGTFNFCTWLSGKNLTLAGLLNCNPVAPEVNKEVQQAGGQPGGIGGYDLLDSNGNDWSCTGPPANNCVPMSCDSRSNCSPTGPAVPQSQVPGQNPSLIGSAVPNDTGS